MPRSKHGGPHELGQNFLHHKPTLKLIARLVARTSGPILEIGPGDGALTRVLVRLQRPISAIEIDERRVATLRREFPQIRVRCADVLSSRLDAPNIVGNLPFHLTTPILRKLLKAHRWQTAIVMTQWEVAKKRASVGGGTMMTAQAAPWFEFELAGRVPAWGFSPRPAVDGGVLAINRRESPLVRAAERRLYEHFVRKMFTGRGGDLGRILENATGMRRKAARRLVAELDLGVRALPRDIKPDQWVALWRAGRG